jgi:hypothetical protein
VIEWVQRETRNVAFTGNKAVTQLQFVKSFRNSLRKRQFLPTQTTYESSSGQQKRTVAGIVRELLGNISKLRHASLI